MQTVAMDHLSIGGFLLTASPTNTPRRLVQQGVRAQFDVVQGQTRLSHGADASVRRMRRARVASGRWLV
jgi:hypothetical protein